MKRFVLDNSVAMRWLLESPKKADQKYAELVLQSLVDANAVVPHLWHIEAISVLLAEEKRGGLQAADVERFIAQLENLPIDVDHLTAHQAFSRTLSLSRAYKLSGYDSTYLELAIREGLPLATLDKDLRKAAIKADVEIYLVND
ncbi:type II toxin-antitoxin system VapC family toxin [Porticoccus sp. W117]|uniref:type II toxin-antitoxin system VapC family toxin n=1 Tax=Porticoccus sp. W117 TaxID=3054777 RepID=UPI0025941A54|nr:type II toxin-antitoxin system VapC family toxin [Porticoccus sp. W117]MDM3870241.1 type II toxin-antitoxin system VapC family toxin [Porticoccus sp. W117]